MWRLWIDLHNELNNDKVSIGRVAGLLITPKVICDWLLKQKLLSQAKIVPLSGKRVAVTETCWNIHRSALLGSDADQRFSTALRLTRSSTNCSANPPVLSGWNFSVWEGFFALARFYTRSDDRQHIFFPFLHPLTPPGCEFCQQTKLLQAVVNSYAQRWVHCRPVSSLNSGKCN